MVCGMSALVPYDQLFKQQVANSFSRSAATYNQVAELQRRVANQLLSRLPQQRVNDLLDLGTGTGYALPVLRQYYPDARLLGLDLAEGMLNYTASHRANTASEFYLMCADAEYLPLADQSLDLIYSSLSVQWCRDYSRLFDECYRVLKPGGQLHIATLGPKSLWQLREAWQQVDNDPHVNAFLPLDSVIDSSQLLQLTSTQVELIELSYPDLTSLLKALKTLGASVVEGRPASGLGGRERLRLLNQAYQTFRRPDGLLPLTYEVYFFSWTRT